MASESKKFEKGITVDSGSSDSSPDEVMSTKRPKAGVGSTEATDGAASTEATDGDGCTEATDGAGSTEAADGAGCTEAADGAGSTEATDGAGSTEATEGAGSTEATDGAGSTEATDGAGSTEATDGAGSTKATDGAGSTEATDGAGSTEATDGAGSTEATDGVGSTAEICVHSSAYRGTCIVCGQAVDVNVYKYKNEEFGCNFLMGTNPFLMRVFETLGMSCGNEDVRKAISWGDDSASLIIHNFAELNELVSARYSESSYEWKQGFADYGFIREGTYVYRHRFLCKDKPELLRQIVFVGKPRRSRPRKGKKH